MIHIDFLSKFCYSTDPFGAFRAELIYGRNQRDFAFLPSSVPPVDAWWVRRGGEVVRIFYSQKDAEAFSQHHHLSYGKIMVLPENRFVIVKKQNGSFAVVPGEDHTPRLLLFAGEVGGYRGGVAVRDETSAQIMARAEASNRCESSCQIAALLTPGQQLVFHSYGRRSDHIIRYTWDGKICCRNIFHFSEWEYFHPEHLGGERI